MGTVHNSHQAKTMDDSVIDEVAIHYNVLKNKVYRDRVITRFATFISFLQQHGLTSHQLLDAGELPTTATRIMRSDLTDEGWTLVTEGYDKWLKAMNNGLDPTDTSLLVSSLGKIRQRTP